MRKYLWLVFAIAFLVLALLMQFVFQDALWQNFHRDPSGFYVLPLIPVGLKAWQSIDSFLPQPKLHPIETKEASDATHR